MSRVLVPLLRSSWRTLRLRPLVLRRDYSVPIRNVASNPKSNPFTAQDGLVDYADKYLHGPAPEGVKIMENQMNVTIDGNRRWFRYGFLRDACKCPLCVDQHSKQRKFRLTDIPHYITPRSVKWDGKKLEVQWANDIKGFDPEHTSVYEAVKLQVPQPNPPKSDTGRHRKRMMWTAKSMEELQHWISYEDYMNDEKKFITAMRNLSLLGIIFVKDIPDSREMVEKIATRMGPLRNTFYGPTWDVRSVPEAKNVAYTNVFLGFHMDLMYMNEPPGYQLLHCLENSCDGGESLFTDSFRAANEIRSQRPDLFQYLTEFRLNYEYDHKEHVYNNSWPVVEMEDGNLSKSIARVNYSPPFQGPSIANMMNHERYAEFTRALKQFTYEIERKRNIFQLKLNPGECVIFENRRVLHARNQFNTEQGKRWLAGAYVDEDALLSTFRTCRNADSRLWGKPIERPVESGSVPPSAEGVSEGQ
ncbi:putative Gamma-butyrobetaine hydroxylase subfamily [Aspergillus clavatus NRRL 1]|uniref:Gamma-butyrobetaine hydroxylase subfamily, putative n=1 Tax=Aspergillus clavatus (strain ATCC 1007 / CBS 513.65 / DSM 816 / NCTC 3887 / NRRL 1 / QM 1276 / 107) TaxID=344612 RepID=A1C747_ASPCL|nr:Gamma-butyrobetaine hydroxylase subfamily, putative [Aspergillus clavatus NRRL 1]EAW14218.1 Gamma-butyrobetaine hydroxylase subfamily, putative [Aspergillus clavatus NRRL 1]